MLASRPPSDFSTDSSRTPIAKKRRRRAPTTGAAEDCFACRKRQSPCDRKRPYCSQCLEVGKDCSGYRTTLTWGVGVASRGKLRGMALPVVNSTQQAPTSAPDSKARSAPIKVQRPNPKLRMASSSPTLSIAHSHYADNLSPSDVRGSASPSYNWGTPPPSSYPPSAYSPAGSLPSPHTSLSHSYEDSILSSSTGSLHSAHSIGAYSDSSCDPSDFPQTPDDSAYMAPYMSYRDATSLPFGQLPSSGVISDFSAASHPIQMPAHHMTDGQEQQLHYHDSYSPPTFEDQHAVQWSVEMDEKQIKQETREVLSSTPTSFSIPQNIQQLIDYYDKAICPVLVTLDGVDNPYRMHILPLVGRSACLQNAIAALATNNMRMRGISDVALLASKPSGTDNRYERISEMAGKPSLEEQHYKAKSIEYLNAHLAHPVQARDDAVLATLLILCLFHVCDSGFSKFSTQLAGVQKLLTMRGSGPRTEFVRWVEMFFAWFDVMTAAVNDREVQIHGASINIMDLSNNLGSLEQFSGCDGRLFKLIARLGRLNLLSQGRPVRDINDATPRASPQPLSTDRKSPPKDYYSIDFGRVETRDWESPRPLESPGSLSGAQDTRHLFWGEWRDLRMRLQEWEFDSLNSPTMCSASLPMPERELVLMSETFRYSALLYLERLAHPHIPSTSLNIQNLVAQALFHINEIGVNSCVTKFMLWPLFITGAECVDERHRSLVRNRCVEIFCESGFFNNISALEVLEKVWTDEDAGLGGRGHGTQAFRWRKAMDKADGEYIVV